MFILWYSVVIVIDFNGLMCVIVLLIVMGVVIDIENLGSGISEWSFC